MIKKLLIVFGILLVLGGACCGGGMIYAFLKAKDAAESLQVGVRELQAIEKKHAFSEPADGEADADRLQDYFAVRQEMTDWAENHPTLKRLAKGEEIGMMEGLGLIVTLPKEAMEQAAATLDSYQMAPSEYFFYTEKVYLALDAGKALNDPKFTEAFGNISGVVGDINQQLQGLNNPQFMVDMEGSLNHLSEGAPTPSPETMEAVRGHLDKLIENPFASFVDLWLLANRDAVESGQLPAPTVGGMSAPQGSPGPQGDE